MPYASDFIGVYRVIDTVAGACYVGQSRRVKKRVTEHFRLLRLGIHPNYHMQQAFREHGEPAFTWEVEAVCDGTDDLDTIEEAFLTGEALFSSNGALFNISSTAKTPMTGRRHSTETKLQIANSKRGRVDHVTPEYRVKLSAAHRDRFLRDPAFVAKIEFIVNNGHLSYAERGRQIGADTSSVRRLALKYAHLKQEHSNAN